MQWRPAALQRGFHGPHPIPDEGTGTYRDAATYLRKPRAGSVMNLARDLRNCSIVSSLIKPTGKLDFSSSSGRS